MKNSAIIMTNEKRCSQKKKMPIHSAGKEMPRSQGRVSKLRVLTTLMAIIEEMRVGVKRGRLASRDAGVGN